MNLREVRSVIENNRKLTEMCSLPFYLVSEKCFAWFSFEFKEDDGVLKTNVNCFYKLTMDGNLETNPDEYTFEVVQEDIKEPTIDEIDYYDKLDNLINQGSDFDMVELLEKVDMGYLIGVYKYFIK
jgi:hypothetical protein